MRKTWLCLLMAALLAAQPLALAEDAADAPAAVEEARPREEAKAKDVEKPREEARAEAPEKASANSEEKAEEKSGEKAEEGKAEEKKSEEKQEAPAKAEDAKAEEPKAEEAKAEEPKAEASEAAEGKAAEPAAEEAKSEENQAEHASGEITSAEQKPEKQPSEEQPSEEQPSEEHAPAQDVEEQTPGGTTEEPSEGTTEETPGEEGPEGESTEEPTQGESTEEPTEGESTEEGEPTEKPTEGESTEEEPTEEPTEEPGDDPTEAPAGALVVSTTGAGQGPDGAVQWKPGDALAFSWNAVEGAVSYAWTLTLDGGAVAEGSQAECALTVDSKDFAAGSYTLTVKALSEAGEALCEGKLEFLLAEDKPEKPDGPGGRQGFPRGFRLPKGFRLQGYASLKGLTAAGAQAGAAGMAQAEGPAGFTVVPGEALTDSHTSGSRDMSLYGTVALSDAAELDGWLALDDTVFEIARADGGDFAPTLSDATLTLDAGEDSPAWRLNLLALEVLRKSGVETLRLRSAGGERELSTRIALTGPIYGLYRSQGFVSKDMTLIASAGDLSVEIDGHTYGLGADGALTAP